MNPFAGARSLHAENQARVNSISGQRRQQSGNGVFWRGADGKVYVKGGSGVNSAGAYNGSTSNYWTQRGFAEIADPNAPKAKSPDTPIDEVIDGGGGGGYVEPPKVLDTAQLQALDSLLARYDRERQTRHAEAAKKRDTAKAEKEREREREKGKYEGKKLTTLQDFGGAKTETDLNVRNTLENLMSSLSTMNLGGSRALTRQILAAANQSNRKANATQATNQQGLDSAFNEYESGYKDDITKIGDQYQHDIGVADKTWGENRQNTLYKKADVYGAADKSAEREQQMGQANTLNSLITNSAFINPKYDGKSRAMATPELADYTQDIAQYNTTGVGGGAGVPGATAPGNLAIKAIAVNERDLGVKKKTENDLGYGV